MEDYYLNDNNCIERLKNELKSYPYLIVAYNFDNTVYDVHNKGISFNNVIDALRECKNILCRGKFQLIAITDEHEDSFAKEYLSLNNIPFDYINTNVPMFNPKSGKIYYSILLDDRAGLKSSYHYLLSAIKFVKSM
jgi:hypothetical protein